MYLRSPLRAKACRASKPDTSKSINGNNMIKHPRFVLIISYEIKINVLPLPFKVTILWFVKTEILKKTRNTIILH